ncbi:amidohydrolase [Peptoniphilus sp. KCTC 25270]|uniref:amidohydrolase n=1 Tax=Peptoniphilus sp. KCTC 25270 TaxID=2897414 RepID=UPI001E5A0E1B|nr:amidohydrolase [Peptoniphilus sp. KCTC 25270]MCD1148004.1 amidohydrolase [Peptoniphilus sp. KCTC 25270]
MKKILKNAMYIDVINGEVVKGKDIVIEEDRIVSILPTGKETAGEILDMEGFLITPGFINAHTHLGMSYFRNLADDMDLDTWLNEAIWPLEDHLNPEDIYWGSLLSMAEGIRSGATTFCDMYYEMDRVAEAAEKIGMRGMLTRGLTSFGGGEEKLEETKKLYEQFHNSSNGLLRVIPAPHAIYTCNGEYLKKVFDLSRSLDNQMHIHASETKKEVEDCKKENNGRTPIQYLLDLGMEEIHTVAAHCVHMTEEEMDLANTKYFFPVYNPSSNLKLASGFTPIAKLLEKGFTVALGTDGDSSNNNQDMLEEMHIASIVNKAVTGNPEAVSALEVLKMATINGAKALGWEKEIGSIEVGKKADLAFFSLESPNFTPRNNLMSALCYSANSEDVKHVMVDGEFVLKNRELVRIDLKETMETVEERLAKLIERKEGAK